MTVFQLLLNKTTTCVQYNIMNTMGDGGSAVGFRRVSSFAIRVPSYVRTTDVWCMRVAGEQKPQTARSKDRSLPRYSSLIPC